MQLYYRYKIAAAQGRFAQKDIYVHMLFSLLKSTVVLCIFYLKNFLRTKKIKSKKKILKKCFEEMFLMSDLVWKNGLLIPPVNK